MRSPPWSRRWNLARSRTRHKPRYADQRSGQRAAGLQARVGRSVAGRGLWIWRVDPLTTDYNCDRMTSRTPWLSPCAGQERWTNQWRVRVKGDSVARRRQQLISWLNEADPIMRSPRGEDKGKPSHALSPPLPCHLWRPETGLWMAMSGLMSQAAIVRLARSPILSARQRRCSEESIRGEDELGVSWHAPAIRQGGENYLSSSAPIGSSLLNGKELDFTLQWTQESLRPGNFRLPFFGRVCLQMLEQRLECETILRAYLQAPLSGPH